MKKFIVLLSILSVAYTSYAQTELWGMTSEGGQFSGGAIFNTDAVGNNEIVQESFFQYEGANPQYGDLLQASDGKFYGMTYIGGVSNLGILFQFDPVTSSYSKRVEFDGAVKGANPKGSLIQATDGKIYGVTSAGGTNNLGVLFQFDPTNSNYVKLLDFGGTLYGSAPTGSLIQASNGLLYGLTSAGGTTGWGVIFSYNISTSIFTKLIDFNGAARGGYPHGSLLQASNGMLYGMTTGGGNNSYGVIFDYDPVSAVFTKRLDFNGVGYGRNPEGSFIQASDGMLYGMVNGGGSNAMGTLIQFNPISNSCTNRLNFAGTANGLYPYGSLMQATDGKLYGMTEQGGTSNNGVLFQFDPATSVYVKELDFNGNTTGRHPDGSLMQASDGSLYGMTKDGGSNIAGVIFQFNPVSTVFTLRISFSASGLQGKMTYGNLMRASDGKLYGMTLRGGSSDMGVLFQFDPATSIYTVMFNFAGTASGKYPYGSLMQASNGKLYGMTINGGTTDNGVLFQFDPVTSVFTKLIDFAGASNGANPCGNLIQASNGNLYGLTSAGGTNGSGVIFKYNLVTSTFTKLFDFTGYLTGGTPYGSLMQATNGKLYGLTNSGGLNYEGTIFSYDPTSSVFADVYDFVQFSNGQQPTGSLIQATNGLLYGVTITGGLNNFGAIFEFNPTTNSYVDRFDFDGFTNGNAPVGTLLQATDGNLYGFTKYGGVDGIGSIFRFNPITSALTTTQEFHGLNGKYPFNFSTLIEIPASSTINTSAISTNLCAGDFVNIPFTISSSFVAGNVFTAQLSDANGSFTSPVNIGTLNSTTAGTIVGTIPAPTPQGSGYRIRVVSSTPIVAGANNGANITVNAPITVSSPSQTVCLGSSILMTANGATTYSWNPGALSGSSVSVAPISTTTYTVTGTNTVTGCTSTATITITVNPVPNVNASASSSTICSGTNITLSASGASTYSWMPGSYNGNSVSVSPNSSTTYTMTGTDLNGCSATALVPVTVNALPIVIVNPGAVSFCLGSSVTLIATGADTYTWNPGALSGSSISITPPSTITYTITGVDLATGCIGTNSVNVNVLALPNVTATSLNPTICNGSTTTLNGNGAAMYSWAPGSLTGNSVVVTPSTSTTYTLTGTDFYNCSSTATVTVQVNPSPTVVATTTSSSICSGSSTTLIGTGAINYLWNPGSLIGNTVFASPNSTTTFTVTGTDVNGCSNTANISINVNANPIAIGGTVIPAGCNLNNGSINASISGGVPPYNYEWLPGNIQSFTNSNIGAGTYTFAVSDANNCVDSLYVTFQDSCSFVWPGDANEDAIVDNNDILSIGIGNGSTGSVRQNASNNWIGQPAQNWNQSLLSGTDYKYIDCNGNGIIQPSDTIAVVQNFSLSHLMRQGAAPVYDATLPDLKITMGQTSMPSNSQGTLTISVGTNSTPISNLYGIAFTLNFDAVQIDASSFRMNENGTWMGNPSSNLMGVVLNNGIGSGSVQVAITRLNQLNVNGFGTIANLAFMSTGDLVGTGNSQMVNFTISNVTVISANQTNQNVNTIFDSVLVYDSNLPTSVSYSENGSSIMAYPNPFSETTQVFLPASIFGRQNNIVITDVSGRVVEMLNCFEKNSVLIDRKSLETGVYFCSLYSDGKFVSMAKIIVN